MTVTILKGDCRDVLRTLPADSVHCVVTSPPYWGLRDYGIAGQLGLEPTPDAYVAAMVEIFREVRRVLRKDGTLWLVLGDSYAAGGRGGGANGSKQQTNVGSLLGSKDAPNGLKPKDLVGIPWRIAFALQSDGWTLRQDIIWSKSNPMPESVTDRCTKAHEYIFLLSKSAQYYYDAEAIKESSEYPDDNRKSRSAETDKRMPTETIAGVRPGFAIYPIRNKRSVWEVTTQPFSEAHFATFPPALIEPCILAGCPKECCVKCGAPWMRNVEITSASKTVNDRNPPKGIIPGKERSSRDSKLSGQEWNAWKRANPNKFLGFSPSCSCNAGVMRGTVLDPFGGAGTTGLVADRLQRNAILIELNPEYAAMSERRIVSDAPLFVDVRTNEYDGVDDFARSIDECYAAIRERKEKGGPGWEPP
jgi:DNA modification methylase